MITLPDSNIRILGPLEGLDYFDTRSTVLPREVQPLQVWNTVMRKPHPLLQAAMRLRDRIASRFGARKIGAFSGRMVESVKVGDHLDFFLVEHADDNSLVLTGREPHLDVMTCISTKGTTVSVTASVRTHNRFGRAYMLPVGIAHKWIVSGMLRKLRRNMAVS